MKPKAAIYHFTNESKKRPIVYQKQLKALVDYATSMGFEVIDIYCDTTNKKTYREEYRRFLANCDKYDVLVTKDFYHISKNTGTCISDMTMLRDRGIQTYSLENGRFTWEEEPFDKELRVATYTCQYGTPNELKEILPIRNDIFRLFAQKKTSWTIIDQYTDKSKHQKDGEQKQLSELLTNRSNYDLLLVHNLNDIYWRTAKFCAVREQLGLDIYSLKEGFLKFEKDVKYDFC